MSRTLAVHSIGLVELYTLMNALNQCGPMESRKSRLMMSVFWYHMQAPGSPEDTSFHRCMDWLFLEWAMKSWDDSPKPSMGACRDAVKVLSASVPMCSLAGKAEWKPRCRILRHMRQSTSPFRFADPPAVYVGQSDNEDGFERWISCNHRLIYHYDHYVSAEAAQYVKSGSGGRMVGQV